MRRVAARLIYTAAIVGMELHDGDRLTTGANARVLLHAADRQAIKLGENASLTLPVLRSSARGKDCSARCWMSPGRVPVHTATSPNSGRAM